MIKVGLLKHYTTVENAILDILGVSKSRLKKMGISKDFLSKEANKNMAIELPIDLVNSNMINPNYLGPEIVVLHEDENFIVMDKPCRVHGHPHFYSDQYNCLSFLRNKYSDNKIFEVGRENSERGLLYRLDYETSGVLIYCKNENLFLGLRNNFEKSFKTKIYQLAVEGELDVMGPVENFLAPSGKKGAKMKVLPHHDGLLARLEILESEYLPTKNISLVTVKLLTGVRHQIRVQMSHLGHSIVGDPLYGKEGERLMLHAKKYELQFDDIEQSFESGLDLFSLLL
ncbi:MAG: pseudouridine synthase [Bacteriovoracaceae bacterium]